MRLIHHVVTSGIARLRLLVGCSLVAGAAVAWGDPAARTPAEIMPAPAGTLVESGLPNYVVLSAEALGLDAAPAGLTRLPDGRYVAFAQRQIAIGDGTRWEVYDQDASDYSGVLESLMVDDTGRILASMGDEIGELTLLSNNRWVRRAVASFKAAPSGRHHGLARAARAAGAWYWYGNSGTVAVWREAEGLVPLGTVNAISRVFALGAQVFVSDASSGKLYAVAGDRLELIDTGHTNPDDAVTGIAPYAPDRLLVATHGRGVRIFDGRSFTPLQTPALLDGTWHLKDLCGLAGGFFAAAVEDFGVVFFDRSGRIVQTLDSSMDHRLAQARGLVPDGDANVWAVLGSGLVRIEFPAPVSRLDSFVEKGFSFALPYRHRGRLWLRTDRVAQRGVYDGGGRLVRFVPDTPPGFNVHAMLADPDAGLLFAGTRGGLFVHRGDAWELVVKGPSHVRLFNPQPGSGRWFFTADGEIGWVRAEGDRFVAERFPAPECGPTFGGVCAADGTVWVEMGSGKCGRVDLSGPVPRLQVFGPEHGLDAGWVQIARIGDDVRVVVAGRLFRFEPRAGRFRVDDAFDQRLPGLTPSLSGRPCVDAAGRLWLTAQDKVQRFDLATEPATALPSIGYAGPGPYYYIPQADGVVWMHRTNSLVRYDPSLPVPPPVPLRGLITRVQLMADNVSLSPVDHRIDPVRYDSNSLGFRFLATGAPVGASIVFETRLQGSAEDWVPAGSGGTAAFPRLKEGDYVLHVRPRHGDTIGAEDWVAFTVLPPWYRTTAAYVTYGVAAALVAALVAWLGAWLEQREKRRLVRLVDERTGAMMEANRRLAEQVDETRRQATALQTSEERYRRLSAELEARVRTRTEELERQVADSARLNEALRRSQAELGDFAARLEEANVRLLGANRELEAFSYSVSHDLRAPLRNMSGFIELLLRRLRGKVDTECDRQLGIVVAEARRMGTLIDDLLEFSRIGRSDMQRQKVDLAALAEECRRALAGETGDRAIEWAIAPMPRACGDRNLLRQVLENLLGNAVKFTRRQPHPRIEVGCLADRPPGGRLTYFVRDNGAGFDPRYVEKLFGVFQRLHSATEFEGTGIGLANVKRIIDRHGGRVWAEGRPGEGATFYFTLEAAADGPVDPPAAG